MRKYLALLTGLLLFISCSDPEVKPDPPQPVDKINFTIEMTAISTRTVTTKITPFDVSKSYIAVVVNESMLNEYETQAAFVAAVLSSYADQGIAIANLLSAGPDSFNAAGLAPKGKYAVAVFGCDASGTQTTALETALFTTKSVSDNLIDCTFDITISDIVPDGATISVIPSDMDVVYAIFPGEASTLDAHGGDPMVLAQSTVTYMESLGYIDWGNLDSSESLQRGNSKVSSRGMLKGGTEQMVICFAINKYGEVLSEVTCKYFETPKPAPSDCTFELNYENPTFNSIDATIVPSNLYEHYYGDVAVKSFMDSMTEEEFTDGMCMNYPSGIGQVDITEHGSLLPDTEYVLFAFAAKAGCATSPLYKKEFRTPEFILKSGGEAYVEQTVLSIVDGASFQLQGYGVMDILYTPNSATEEYYMAMPSADDTTWDKMTEDQLKKAIALSAGSNDHRQNHCLWFGLKNTDADLYVVGMDAEGQLGSVNHKVVPIILTRGNTMVSELFTKMSTGEFWYNRVIDSKQPIREFAKKSTVDQKAISNIAHTTDKKIFFFTKAATK